MATISPSANSPPSNSSSEQPTTSPPSNSNRPPPPPEPSTSAPPPSNPNPPPPPLSTSHPPPQPPSDSPTTTSPPSQSTDPPPPTPTTPSTISSPPPPPPSAAPPPLASPNISPPPPPDSVSPSPPPPPSSTATPLPPSSTSNPPPPPPPPPPPSNPPETSPPPPSNPPEISLSPPPQSKPPENSPPPPPSPQSKPPDSSPPPPPPSGPPESSPRPPLQSEPPETSPPPLPQSSKPPETSSSSPPPPPPDARAPGNSTPPPEKPPSPPQSNPPKNSPSPPQPASEPPTSSAPPPSKLTPISPSISTSKAPPPPPPLSSQSNNGTRNTSTPTAPETSNPTSNNTNGGGGGGGGGIGLGGMVAIAVVSGMILLGLFGLAAWCIRKQKKRPGVGVYVMPSPLGSSPRSDSYLIKVNSSAPIGSESAREFSVSPPDPSTLGHSRSLFTYEELAKATDGFSAQNLLGEGGFGSVYKGFLPDEREVAVKELKIGGGQGEREFKAEVETISRIHHRHLVSLVGYCISENRRLLVYDYVPNNNLYYHIHEEGKPALDWAKRVKIASGAARGIAYLHEDCNPQIIHRDIKSSNILLNNNFEALVSDFGLAKLALGANTHITTRVMGTFGYVAPEYASSGKLTEKSDVYSFGVVLLELITGRKPVDRSQPVGDESLVEWARPLLSHALETKQFQELADPRLERNYAETEMFKMIEIAAACVRHSAAKRPRMGQVVRAFDSFDTLDLTNRLAVGESKTFDTAEQSAEIRLFRRMAFGSQPYSTDYFSQDYSTA